MDKVRLLECPICGDRVSSDAMACPHCGHPMKSSRLVSIAKEFVNGSNKSRRQHSKKLGFWTGVDTPMTGKSAVQKFSYIVFTVPLIIFLAWILTIIPGFVSGITARYQAPCYDYMVQLTSDPPNGMFLTLSFTYVWPLLAVIKKVWGRIAFYYIGVVFMFILWPIAVIGPLTLYPIDLVIHNPDRLGIFLIMAVVGYVVSLVPTCCLTKWIASALPAKTEENSKR